jgi:hypothetical protein
LQFLKIIDMKPTNTTGMYRYTNQQPRRLEPMDTSTDEITRIWDPIKCQWFIPRQTQPQPQPQTMPHNNNNAWSWNPNQYQRQNFR